MTRYHQFNSRFPEEANNIHQGYQDMSSIIWKAFSSATFLHKFFPFSFTADFDKFQAGELDGAFDEGTEEITKDTQNPL